jgi:hypothetical protein
VSPIAFEPFPSAPEAKECKQGTTPEFIHLNSLDEGEIENWWKNEWKQDPYWRTFSRNCSTLVAKSIMVGFNGVIPSSWANKRVWTPRDVQNFAYWARGYEKYVKPLVGKVEKVPIQPKKEIITPIKKKEEDKK